MQLRQVHCPQCHYVWLQHRCQARKCTILSAFGVKKHQKIVPAGRCPWQGVSPLLTDSGCREGPKQLRMGTAGHKRMGSASCLLLPAPSSRGFSGVHLPQLFCWGIQYLIVFFLNFWRLFLPGLWGSLEAGAHGRPVCPLCGADTWVHRSGLVVNHCCVFRPESGSIQCTFLQWVLPPEPVQFLCLVETLAMQTSGLK